MAAWFTDAADASRYLAEIARIWIVWIAALALLLVMQQWWALLLIGVGLLAAMVVLGRPLQARAAAVPGSEEQVGTKRQVAMGRGRRADDAFRQLLYGEGPLREALVLAGLPSSLVWVRRFVVVITLAAFAWVMFDLFTAGPS